MKQNMFGMKLTMDDVSSETWFVFIKNILKNEPKNHRVVHQSDIIIIIIIISVIIVIIYSSYRMI